MNQYQQQRLKRLAIRTPIFLLGLFVALTLFGRSLSGPPLPLHLAWLATFGAKGWNIAFDLSVQDGWDKEQVVEALGEPTAVMFGGDAYEDIRDIDLYESRRKEYWSYHSPFAESKSPNLVFRSNVLVK